MDWRVQLILTLLEEDLRRTPSADELATKLNLSNSRLTHLFKAEVGCSLTQYLRDLRLRKARILLETTFLSIKETMMAVGMTDPSHFVRDFKKVSGHTPTEYRKLNLKKDQMKQHLQTARAKSTNE
jgi:AraC family transcriptional regulator of arabinose operon